MNQVTESQLEYSFVEGEQPVVTAVVVAAGNGTRMGCNKQMISLLGIPVLARTLMAFSATGRSLSLPMIIAIFFISLRNPFSFSVSAMPNFKVTGIRKRKRAVLSREE